MKSMLPGSTSLCSHTTCALARWISSGFGSGYARVAPGTVGSFVALLFLALLWWFEVVVTTLDGAVLAGVTLVVGYLATQVTTRDISDPDPGWIVIDEWAGLFLALIGTSLSSPLMVLAAFGLFRLFDVVKPGPVGWAERLPGAVGIMADDVVAGMLAGLSVQAVWYLWGVVLA